MIVFVVSLSKECAIARAIAHHLRVELYVPEITTFADGEYEVSVAQAVERSATVILVQSLVQPIHEHLMLYLLTIQALRTAGVARILAVIPYLGYSQQHRLVPGTSKDGIKTVITMLEASGVDACVSVELHAQEIAHWFRIPFYHVSACDAIVTHIKQYTFDTNSVIVSPDHGGADRVRAISQALNLPCLILQKERYAIDITRIVPITTGSIMQHSRAIVVDDCMKTGNTALQTAHLLQQQGIKMIYGYFVHAVFAHDAYQQLVEKKLFTQLFFGNTVDTREPIDHFQITGAVITTIERIIKQWSRNALSVQEQHETQISWE